MHLHGPRGGFQLINNSTQTTKVKPWGFKDEELIETTLNLTFHIATGTLEGMKAKS